jgi:hypothetical protein
MPSRRRSRSKNLNNNLSDVQRRLRSLERRPVRTKLAGRVVTKAAIAPNSVSEDEVSFGTAVVVPPGGDINDVVGQIENPKDGLLVVDTDSGSSKLYSEEEDNYVDITDPIAQQAADDAAADALAAQQAADDAAADAAAALSAAGDAASDAAAAEISANGKSAVFRQSTEPTAQVGGGALRVGDIWFDSTPVTKDGVTDSSGSRPRRYAGPGSTLDARWPSFGLNYLAVTNIDADKIVTGILTGRVVRTAASGKRVELSNTNELIFRGTTIVSGTDTAVVGKIAPDLFGGLGLDIIGGNSTSTSSAIQLRSSEYAGDASITMLTPTGLGVYIYNTTDFSDLGTSTGGVLINGGGATENNAGLKLYSGGGGFEFVDWSGSVYGVTIYAYDDVLSLGADTSISLSSSKIELLGELVLGFGTYEQGSGQPTRTAPTGTVVFRYT